MSLEIETINPSTGETISNYHSITLQELGSKIKRAHHAFEEWKKNLDNRTDHFHNFAQQLRKDKGL